MRFNESGVITKPTNKDDIIRIRSETSTMSNSSRITEAPTKQEPVAAIVEDLDKEFFDTKTIKSVLIVAPKVNIRATKAANNPLLPRKVRRPKGTSNLKPFIKFILRLFINFNLKVISKTIKYITRS